MRRGLLALPRCTGRVQPVVFAWWGRRMAHNGTAADDWSRAQDGQLRRTVGSLLRRDGLQVPSDRLGFWSEVAAHLDGRTSRQCRLRWVQQAGTDALAPKPWTSSDDTRLTELVELHRHDGGGMMVVAWSSVAEAMQRTRRQCRTRWLALRGLHSASSMIWKPEEEAKLAQVVWQYWNSEPDVLGKPPPSSLFKGCIDGKSTRQCLTRWNVLLRQGKRPWSEGEDEQLAKVVEGLRCSFGVNEHLWRKVAKEMWNRKVGECRRRYFTFGATRKDRWTKEEDEHLCTSVGQCGTPIDWMAVSDAVPARSIAQCMTRWKYLKQMEGTQSGDWTESEDVELRNLVEKHGRQWSLISSLLSVHRSGPHCRLRWDNTLSLKSKRKPWTPEEDDMLFHCLHHEQLYGKWNEIAARIPNRSAVQCRARSKALPLDGSGQPWSVPEITLLSDAVTKLGPQWTAVSQSHPLLRTRGPRACRDKWIGFVDPNLRSGSWSVEEDQALGEAVKQHGRMWSQVSTALGGKRAPWACRQRWDFVSDPSIRHDDWTPEEDQQLSDAVTTVAELE